MDINKEFELKQRELFERFRFGDQYDELKAYYDEYESENHDRYPPYTYENEWVAWLTAKAQAVPEGFVLVPKEPIQLFKEKLEDYLFDLWTGDHGCDWDGFLSADAVEHGVLWKMMLEAQEPSHD